VRAGVIARILDKDKGDLIYYYEVIKDPIYAQKGYLINLENMNLKIQVIIATKSTDTLEITGFDMTDIRLKFP
jgi:hypothetical protein